MCVVSLIGISCPPYPLWFAAGVVDTKLPPQAVSELVALSDELDINEVVCVDLWSQVRAKAISCPA